MLKLNAIGLIAGFLVSLAANASAATYSFTFYDDPSASIFNRTHLGGSVTGLIYGLEDDLEDQTPDAVEFTSDVSGLGLVDLFYDVFTFIGGDGISVSGGQITSADLSLNFDDSAVQGTQLRLNASDYNSLIWNGGGGPFAGIGNRDGFAGVTFTQLSEVPVPASLPLILVGMGAFGLMRRRKKA